MTTRNATVHWTIRIPSAELRGTDADKLLQLDAILSRLRAIRRDLARPADDAAPDRSDASARVWWVVGVSVVALLGVFAAVWGVVATGSL